MMGFSTDKLCVFIGLLSLVHAAYSAAQHRAYLRLTKQEFTSLPADVLLQCVLSIVLACYGIVRVVGEFRAIKASLELEKRTWDTLGNRPSFYTFSHRGRFLFHSG